MYIQKSNRFSIAILFIFLATSGFPSFLIFKQYLALLLPFLGYQFYRSYKKTPPIIYKVLVFLCIIALIHFSAGHFTVIGTISFILSYSIILLYSLLYGNNLITNYIKVMRFICYIAVCIWLVLLIPGMQGMLTSIGSSLPQLLSENWIEHSSNEGVSLYIYFLPTNDYAKVAGILRNCGPFYEPGLFASYIAIALTFSLSINHKLLHKDNIIFIISLLSTCSSAGYITFILIIIYSIFFSKNKTAKWISLISILILWQPIMELDFMSEKISNNMQRSTETTASRFGAIIYHSEKIAESPIIGYMGGDMPPTNFDRLLGSTAPDKILSPNGLSWIFVYWGIPLGIIFYTLLFNGTKLLVPRSINKAELWFIFCILLSTGFSQSITTEAVILLIATYSLTHKYCIIQNENSRITHL